MIDSIKQFIKSLFQPLEGPVDEKCGTCAYFDPEEHVHTCIDQVIKFEYEACWRWSKR